MGGDTDMTTFTGGYNALYYVIYRDGIEFYRAGNSPYDSQDYLPAEEGVGIEEMERFCHLTLAEIASERASGMVGPVLYEPPYD